jgi:hypothetical protein
MLHAATPPLETRVRAIIRSFFSMAPIPIAYAQAGTHVQVFLCVFD